MKVISIKEYSALKNTFEYDFVLKHLKPKNDFGGFVFDKNKITYRKMRDCIFLINQVSSFEVAIELYKTFFDFENDSFFWEQKIDVFFSSQNFIIEHIKKIVDTEQKLLQSIDTDTVTWKQAGGDGLNKFSNLMPLVQLGEIYSIYPMDLQDKPYNEILTLLVLHKQRAEIQKIYNELKARE